MRHIALTKDLQRLLVSTVCLPDGEYIVAEATSYTRIHGWNASVGSEWELHEDEDERQFSFNEDDYLFCMPYGISSFELARQKFVEELKKCN